MKKVLLQTLVVATFTLITTFAAKGQPPPFSRNNAEQKIVEIKIKYEFPAGVWNDAYLNYYIPASSLRVRFIIELKSTTQRQLRGRLELRQKCGVQVGDPDVARELRFFASNTPLQGSPFVEIIPTGDRRIFHLEVRTDPPENNPATLPRPHCSGDGDHLGEGPYEALIAVADPPTLTQGSETVNLTYLQQFYSLDPTKFKRFLLMEQINPDSRLKSPAKPGVRRRR